MDEAGREKRPLGLPVHERLNPRRVFLSNRSAQALLLLFALLLVACSSSVPPTLASRFKVFISTSGLYRINAATFQAAGVNPEKLDASTLQVFHGEQEIAVRVSGTGKSLALEFYGQASDSPYSAQSVYALTWGKQAGKRMQQISGQSDSASAITSAPRTVALAQPQLYIPQPEGLEQSWFWQSLTAPMSTTVTATLKSVLPEQAHVKVNLLGSTFDSISPNHHVRVYVNDTAVADERWGGQGAHEIVADISAKVLRDGENVVRLVSPGDTGAKVDVVLLRSVELMFPRVLTAEERELEFEGGPGTYRVTALTGLVEAYDITDPEEPVLASNSSISDGAITFTARADGMRKWFVVGTNRVKPIAQLVPMTGADLSTAQRQADYVIIAPPNFVQALQPLIHLREQQGLKVTVVSPYEIYDEFGNGEESPFAIRSFLQWARTRWAPPAPRNVLLVGKASYDYRDYSNGSNKNLVPTFLVPTPSLGLAASDNWFAALDENDARPTFSIGRIPAKTADEVARVVAKTIAFESVRPVADGKERALFVADDKEETFPAMADVLATKLAANMTVDKVYLGEHGGDVAATRSELIARWNASPSLVTYVGHGSIDTWAAGPLFASENVGELKNTGRLPILFTPTCLDGFFYHPQKDSLVEDLLFAGSSGIVAGIAPTGLSTPDAQSALMEGLFDELFSGRGATLGQALDKAKAQMAVDSPGAREVIETFGLLGDPALRVGQ